MSPRAKAVASLVERDGRFLCVWNRRYRGWTFPGGKVEHGESVEAAQARAQLEETGLRTLEATPLYDAPELGRHVHVFRVAAEGEPWCALRWMTRRALLSESPFAPFYTRMFAALIPVVLRAPTCMTCEDSGRPGGCPRCGRTPIPDTEPGTPAPSGGTREPNLDWNDGSVGGAS